jgi:hypothetical protein
MSSLMLQRRGPVALGLGHCPPAKLERLKPLFSRSRVLDVLVFHYPRKLLALRHGVFRSSRDIRLPSGQSYEKNGVLCRECD